MSAKEAWTPYGLEAIRIGYLRRRRFFAIMAALALAGIWALMFETVNTSDIEIFANGNRVGSSISIDAPEIPKDGPVSVALDPGRVTRAEAGNAEPQETVQRTGAPVSNRAAPVEFGDYLFFYGPFLLLALAAFFLAKKKGRHDQVNYGIYKGAMPLELVSSSMSNHVFTTRWAKTGLFGKRRGDYLPDEIIRIERVSQEEA